MTDQAVTYTVDDGVATITLNRPDAMNSLDVATKEALLVCVLPGGAPEAPRTWDDARDGAVRPSRTLRAFLEADAAMRRLSKAGVTGIVVGAE